MELRYICHDDRGIPILVGDREDASSTAWFACRLVTATLVLVLVAGTLQFLPSWLAITASLLSAALVFNSAFRWRSNLDRQVKSLMSVAEIAEYTGASEADVQQKLCELGARPKCVLNGVELYGRDSSHQSLVIPAHPPDLRAVNTPEHQLVRPASPD